MPEGSRHAEFGEGMIELPEYAKVVRTLKRGEHSFVMLLPHIANSPASRRIESPKTLLLTLLKSARVRIEPLKGYVWIDEKAPAIILVEDYYRHADSLDLYLDLIHELTHLRQLAEGHDVWDERYRYVDRPTEIEGYAIAVEEGLRLGMAEPEIIEHLSNPWMTRADVRRLRQNVAHFLTDGFASGGGL